eukprot:1149906-Pelagomonas_calceolata.AAC.8
MHEHTQQCVPLTSWRLCCSKRSDRCALCVARASANTSFVIARVSLAALISASNSCSDLDDCAADAPKGSMRERLRVTLPQLDFEVEEGVAACATRVSRIPRVPACSKSEGYAYIRGTIAAAQKGWLIDWDIRVSGLPTARARGVRARRFRAPAFSGGGGGGKRGVIAVKPFRLQGKNGTECVWPVMGVTA